MLDPLHNRATNWPTDGRARSVWIYSDPDLYARELDVIFYGPTWSYVGLASEVPERGSFKRTFIGERPVIMTRDEDGKIQRLVNRMVRTRHRVLSPSITARSTSSSARITSGPMI